MKNVVVLSAFVFAAAPPPAFAASPTAAPASESPKLEPNLLPRSLQHDPKLDVTVVTETTEAGEARAVPTAERPAYYVLHAAGYRETGHGVRVTQPAPDVLQQATTRALAGANYRPASAAHAPDVALISHWGSYNRLDREFPDRGAREFMTRVSLIGGRKLADEVFRAVQQEEALRGPETGAPLETNSLLSPYYQLQERNAVTRRILDQAKDDSYGLIVSAYDYPALARGERRLLWRTKISTDASGLNFAQTVPVLASAGRDYYGRPMETPATVTRTLFGRDRVELGEPTVVDEAAAASPSPEQDAIITQQLKQLEVGLFDYGSNVRRTR